MSEPLLTRRSTYTLLILGFVISVLLFTLSAVKQRQEIRERAAGTTSLSLTANPSSVTVGQEVVISVTIDTGANQAAATDLYLTFDQAVFDFVSLQNGGFLPNEFIAGSATGGVARIALYASALHERQGVGTLAVLRLRAKQAAAASTIDFDPRTGASALGETGNVVVSKTPVTVAVTEVAEVVTPDSKLFILPAVMSINPGETVALPIYLDTRTNHAVGVDLVVTYDGSRFEGIKISSGGFLPETLVGGTIDNGLAKIVVTSIPGTSKQGNGAVAILELKAKNVSGTTHVTIDPSTQASAPQSTVNIVKELAGAEISIGAVSTSPTPVGCVAPVTPTAVSATALNSNQVSLSWTGSRDNSYYGIVYGTKSKNYSWGASNVGSTTSFTVSRLSPNTRYYFAVFAVNDCGTTGYSNEANVLVPLSIGGTGTTGTHIVPTPKATPKNARVSPEPSFEPIDPGSDASQFLAAKPKVSVSPAPQVTIPEDYQANQAQPLLTPVRVTIGVLVLLLIVTFILFKRA